MCRGEQSVKSVNQPITEHPVANLELFCLEKKEPLRPGFTCVKTAF